MSKRADRLHSLLTLAIEEQKTDHLDPKCQYTLGPDYIDVFTPNGEYRFVKGQGITYLKVK